MVPGIPLILSALIVVTCIEDAVNSTHFMHMGTKHISLIDIFFKVERMLK
jgi:hypothetical protein